MNRSDVLWRDGADSYSSSVRLPSGGAGETRAAGAAYGERIRALAGECFPAITVIAFPAAGLIVGGAAGLVVGGFVARRLGARTARDETVVGAAADWDAFVTRAGRLLENMKA